MLTWLPLVLLSPVAEPTPAPPAAPETTEAQETSTTATPTATPTETPTAPASATTTTTPTPDPDTAPALAPVVEQADAWDWGFGGLPALGYDTDNGFLVGAVAQVFLHDPAHTRPYRIGINVGATITTKLVQDHYIAVDWLNFADLPLRLSARIGWSQSLTQNFCGTGMTVTCDSAVADAAADAAGLKGVERDDFLRHYYLFRFMNPSASLQGRWALSPLPRRVEIFGGWRGSGYIPGTWADDDGDGEADYEPYTGSLYADVFPKGEPGFASVLQVGAMYDTRDNEPSPRSGLWAEASVRAATPFWGSSWTWAGANLTARSYVPIISGDAPLRLTLASRLVGDIVVGDPPIQELVRPGGFVDYLSFGGSEMGRGVRVQRYVGKLKLFLQNELRWRFVEFAAGNQHFAFSTNLFADAGIVGTDLADKKAFAGTPPVGAGLGVLFHWNENFVLRVDVATSVVEAFSPGVYITLGQTF